MIRIFGIVLLFTIMSFAQNQNLAESIRQLEAARELYNDRMIELEKEAATRWKNRQKAVLEKQQNSEQLEQSRREVEQLYTEVARVREEKLAREELVRVEESRVEQAQANWKALAALLEQKRNDGSAKSGGHFPIGFESRMAAVAAVDRLYPGNQNPAEAFGAMIETQINQLRDSRTTSTETISLVDEQGNPQEALALRIGHAYALARTDSAVYYLSFFGEEAAVPFKWQMISEPVAAQNGRDALRNLSENKHSLIPVDFLQNDQSQELITGEQLSFWTKTVTFFKKGGIITVPLLILAIWSLLIVINRIVVYAVVHHRDYAFINRAVVLLESGEIEEAKTFAEKGKGVLARVLNSCIKHADQSRTAAEQSVKEMLLGELPALDKHLDTLAVIAGAAPLMGLLGTVTGMITMFESITRFGTGDPKLLAGGISEALITTEIGLAIAIPVLLIHNWLRNRRNGIQSEMEIYAMRILNRLWPAE